MVDGFATCFTKFAYNVHAGRPRRHAGSAVAVFVVDSVVCEHVDWCSDDHGDGTNY